MDRSGVGENIALKSPGLPLFLSAPANDVSGLTGIKKYISSE